MNAARPNEAYYRLCTGSWTAPLDVHIVSLRKLFLELGILDALGFLALRCVPKPLRRLRTEVWFEGEMVIHTTRADCLGLPLLSGREEIFLNSDGLGLKLEGTQRSAPFWWQERQVSAKGLVDSAGVRARYEIEWYGSPMVQETIATENAVCLKQSSSWFKGCQMLVRVGTPTSTG